MPENQRSDDRQLIQSGYRYAVSLSHNRHDAEDLIQQACLKVLSQRGTLVGKSYLFAAIRNLFYDSLRKRQRIENEPLSSESVADTATSHTNIVEQKIDLAEILSCLRVEEREVLFLQVVEGYTAQEISTLTQQPRGTVLSLLSRARQRIQQRYDLDQILESK
ncbi:ECF RNA polymerase sigma factor SigE [Gimesia alba]|uniref:ECF RNA polymerase sigma factor SigE n=1 Tax=Gimesia alba TaxID=2527973 RepID=A0A517RDC6_9PLAN|nr:RNA polymerase sigma factor [Gimesia alba]QDT41881.1 ECF RNA polymerase sigma factor SigE [Gimesia alba]